MDINVKRGSKGFHLIIQHNGHKYTSTPLSPDDLEYHQKRLFSKGGKLSVGNLKNLLNASYDGNDNMDGYEKDHELSTKTTKVYKDINNGQVVVAHKGTTGLKDWLNNAVYAVKGIDGYKKTKRYKEASAVQQKAEQRYGASNISTIGHSQGGLQAELLGKNTKEIITLNKATHPFINRSTSNNQHDIRTKNDIVSIWSPFKKKKNGNETTIKSNGNNILKEHSIDTLNRIDPNMEVGAGKKKKKH